MYPDRREYSDLLIPQIEEQLKDPYWGDEHHKKLLEELFRQFDEIERAYLDDVDHTEYDELEKEQMKEKEREKQKYLLNRPNKLIRHYLKWLQFPEYAEVEHDGNTYLTQVSKRGNARYMRNIQKRIEGLENQLPTIRFFDEKDRSNVQTSPLLFIGLTYDHEQYTIYDAWERVGRDFNRYLANLRKHFGYSVKQFRTWEAHEDGYPHIHLVTLTKKQLPAVFMKSTKPGKKGAWRYKDYKTPRKLKNGKLGKSMKELWSHGHDDVRVTSSVEGIFQFPDTEASLSLTYNIKYITKDIASNPNNRKALLQSAILWIMKKRAFSFSRSIKGENLFIRDLCALNNDLNIVISNSNPIIENPNKTGKSYNFVAHRHNFSYIVKHSNIPPDKIIHKADPKHLKMINEYYEKVRKVGRIA